MPIGRKLSRYAILALCSRASVVTISAMTTTLRPNPNDTAVTVHTRTGDDLHAATPDGSTFCGRSWVGKPFADGTDRVTCDKCRKSIALNASGHFTWMAPPSPPT
jgi:hypothetical protein